MFEKRFQMKKKINFRQKLLSLQYVCQIYVIKMKFYGRISDKKAASQRGL